MLGALHLRPAQGTLQCEAAAADWRENVMKNHAPVVALLAVGTLAGCTSDPDTRVWRRHEAQRKGSADAQPRQVITAALPPDEALVFCFFRAPTESPLYLATSRDGYTWRESPGGPIFTPQAGPYRGVRDPVIERGPDGTYHMVFTWGIHNPRGIGYASSRDLITWTDVRSLEVWPPDVPSEACWAPELFYLGEPDATWLIVWSSEITGRFPGTDGQSDANHRLCACTTTDFRTLSQPELFFDPGYTVIDPDIVENPDGGAILFFKDERDKGKAGRKKQIRFVTGPSPRGPWSEPSEAISVRWSEGPSVLRLGDEWIVYFDEYQSNRYGAVRSPDLVQWQDVSRQMSFPPGQRHGSVLRVPAEVADRIDARRSP